MAKPATRPHAFFESLPRKPLELDIFIWLKSGNLSEFTSCRSEQVLQVKHATT